jgi:hypothetical protein
MRISTKCMKCGNCLTCEAGESLYTGKLKWYLSCSCSKCGSVSEADGLGLPPEDVRTAIINESGLWRLELIQKKTHVIAAKVLTNAFDIPRTVALASLGPEGIWKGTKTEVEWLIGLLGKAGVDARSEQDHTKEMVDE